MRDRWRKAAIWSAAIVLLATTGWFARFALLRVALEGGVALATGYRLQIGSLHAGGGHFILHDVHLSRRGDRVLDVDVVDIGYVFRDVFPGGKRRYGLTGIALQRPRVYVIRRTDGSFNISLPQSQTQPGGPAGPMIMEARATNGSIDLVDPNNLDPSAHHMRVENIDFWARVDTATLTRYRVNGTLDLEGHAYPVHAQASIDVGRGYAMQHVTAADIPIRGLGNFLINSDVALLQHGDLRDLDLRVYSLNVRPNVPFVYHLAGGARLSDVGVKLDVLTQTVQGVHGSIVFDDDTIVSPKMAGRIGATPLVLAGGMYDFSQPKFRLAVLTREDLRILHRDFNFLRTEPLAGQLAATCMLEGSVSDPLILADATAKEVFYKRIPVRNFRATIAYHRGVVFAGNVHAQVGGIQTRVAARFLVGGKDVDSELALAADAPPGGMPYLDRIAPHARTHITIAGSGINLLLDTHAVLTAHGPNENVSATFALNPQGVGEVGMFNVQQARGGIDGAFIMDRVNGSSALWLAAAGLTLYPANPQAALEGVELPSFPPITGRFDGQVAGVDINEHMILVGKGLAQQANFLGVSIARARAEFGGPLDRLALAGIDANGEFGHFVGRGALRSPGFAFAGNLDGTLEGMRRWTGDLGAFGGVHGPVAVISDGTTTLVQTPGVALVNGRIHGVPMQRIEGTFAVKPSGIVVYAAAADVAGGRAVARGNSRDGIVLATGGLEARHLRSAGLPVSSGTIIGTGALRLTGPHEDPAFQGSIALDDGRVLGRRIDGSANIAFAGNGIGIDAGAVSLAHALTFVDGRIDDVGATPHYNVHADLGYADLGVIAHSFRLPVPYLQGYAAGNVYLRGYGKSPSASGTLQIPIGSINGLAFEDMRALVDVHGDDLSANGKVTVGTTHASFDVLSGNGIRGRLDSDDADLSDFNDFFPRADTFAGRGSVHAHVVRNKSAFESDGNIDLRGLRYLSFPFGDTKATWTGANGNISGNLHVAGAAGSLDGSGSIAIPRGTKFARLADATRVDVHGAARDIDLGVWLPAIGYTPTVLGHVNASGAIRGQYPALALDLDAEMDDARIGRLGIDYVRISAAAQGGPGQSMRTQIRSADISLAGVDLHGSGSLGIRPQDPLTLDLDAHAPHLGDVVQRLTGKPYDLDGIGDIHVALSGTISRPTAQATFSISPLRLSRLLIPSLTGTAVIDRERLALRDATVNFPTGKISLSGGAPLVARPGGIPATLPLSFDLALDGIGMDQFAVLGPPHTKLDGVLAGSVQVRGTVGAPRLAGGIELTGGAYSGPLETKPISGINAALAFNETSVALSRFVASVGGGSLTGTGSLELPTPTSTAQPTHYSAAFTADGVRMAFPGYGSFRADGSMAITSEPNHPGLLTGDVHISDASIPLNDFLKASATSASPFTVAAAVPVKAASAPSLVKAALPIPEWLEDLRLNLRIEAGNNVRIRSPILDIGGTGSVQIAGRLRDPTLEGELSATPGGSLFLNRAFKLQEASVRFSPTNGIAPALYARATTQIQPVGGFQPIDVTVTAQGLIPDVKLSYASNPPYDEGTIVGLLFNATALGASVGSLNAFAPTTNILLPPNAFEQTPSGTFALSQEASSLINAQFTARLLAPIEQGLGSAFGLSDLSINVAPTGSVGVEARRLLGNNLSAIYGTSLQYPYRMTFGLESRPTPETSLVFTAFTQQGLYPFGEVKPDSYLSANPLLGSAADVGGTYGFTVNIQRRSH